MSRSATQGERGGGAGMTERGEAVRAEMGKWEGESGGSYIKQCCFYW